MSSLKKRLILSAISVPILVFSIIITNYNYICFFLVIMFASITGTYEMKQNILSKIGKTSNVAYLSILLPLIEYIQLAYIGERNLTLAMLAIIAGLAFLTEIIHDHKDEFKGSAERIARTLLVAIYPNLFCTFVVRFIFLPDARWFLILFFFLVFFTDTFAYFFGMAFGKNNRGFVKVSPNKSIAGYAGGIAVPTITAIAASLLFPNVFVFTPWQGAILGFSTAIFACIGDLIESTFKRSAGVKDAGKILPGRGGMLDSIDSIAIAAPIYLVLIETFIGV